jgi:hypothetical protein
MRRQLYSIEDKTMTMASTLLAELEDAEYHALVALGRTAPGSRRRVQLREALAAARVAKASLLARSPDILRKGAGGKLAIALPVPAGEVAKRVHETQDRIAEEQRLAGPGRRRYRAPEELRGKSLRLVDGSRIDVPDHGRVEVPDGRHPAGASEGPLHRQLLELGFEPLPDDRRDGLDVVKAAHRHPIIGDEALLAFLSRNCNEELKA